VTRIGKRGREAWIIQNPKSKIQNPKSKIQNYLTEKSIFARGLLNGWGFF
jgi:hypothetical protein